MLKRETKTIEVVTRQCDFCERAPVSRTCGVCGRDLCDAHAVLFPAPGISAACPLCRAAAGTFAGQLADLGVRRDRRQAELTEANEAADRDYDAAREAVLARWKAASAETKGVE